MESGSSDNSSTTGGSAMVGSLNVKSQTHAKLSFLMKKVLGVENDDLGIYSFPRYYSNLTLFFSLSVNSITSFSFFFFSADVFATGCDSLSATQFVCQIRDNFKVDLPIKALYTSSMYQQSKQNK